LIFNDVPWLERVALLAGLQITGTNDLNSTHGIWALSLYFCGKCIERDFGKLQVGGI
jgi:hypothetical protein